MTKTQRIILLNQKQYNSAFTNWIRCGEKKDEHWQKMFQCISFTCLNKAKAMLKGKVFIDDVKDKAMDCACHIMEREEKEAIFIRCLGAFCGDALMNFIFAKKVKNYDRTDSLEKVQEESNYEPTYTQEEEKLYTINGKTVTQEQIKDDKEVVTDIFMELWGQY